MRLVFPIRAFALALLASARWGLFNTSGLPTWVTVPVGVVVLDLAISSGTFCFTGAGAWRFRRMLHADLELDVTTRVRFHPIEILLSMAIKLVVVLALGTPALAVVASKFCSTPPRCSITARSASRSV